MTKLPNSMSVRWDITAPIGEITVHNCFADIMGEIFVSSSESDETCIGKVRGVVCHFEPLSRKSEDVLTAINYHWEDLGVLVGPVFHSPCGVYNHLVVDALGDVPLSSNLVLLTELQIVSKHRGQGLSQLVIESLQELLAPARNLMVLNITPTQFREHHTVNDDNAWLELMALDDLEQNKDSASNKLRKHFAAMGFSSIGDSPVMVRSIDVENELKGSSQ